MSNDASIHDYLWLPDLSRIALKNTRYKGKASELTCSFQNLWRPHCHSQQTSVIFEFEMSTCFKYVNGNRWRMIQYGGIISRSKINLPEKGNDNQGKIQCQNIT